MSLESRSNSIKKNHSKPYAAALSDLSPFSTLACQVEATNTWRKDLKSLFTRAGERFADVSWTSGDQDDVSMTDEEGRVPSMRSSPSHRESVVWAHKGEWDHILILSKDKANAELIISRSYSLRSCSQLLSG